MGFPKAEKHKSKPLHLALTVLHQKHFTLWSDEHPSLRHRNRLCLELNNITYCDEFVYSLTDEFRKKAVCISFICNKKYEEK